MSDSASFADLWLGYSMSSAAADAVLAAELARLTRNDAARVERLMHIGGLGREEWYSDKEYLPRIVEGAIIEQAGKAMKKRGRPGKLDPYTMWLRWHLASELIGDATLSAELPPQHDDAFKMVGKPLGLGKKSVAGYSRETRSGEIQDRRN